ncbi:MAG: integrase [Sulfuricurvum sp. PC08-66]|nr:MAG: integrase [Sulfuricurvum sp. PC08-66]
MSNELEAFIEYITINKALAPLTVQAYTQDLVHIEEAARKPLISLEHKAVLGLVMHINNRRTLNRKLSALNAFFAYCFEATFASDKQKFRLSKIPKNLPHYLEIEMIRKGLSLIDTTTWLGLRDYALILFLFATGTRISEALALQKNDIDGEWVKIRYAKGQKERIVPIATEAVKALKMYIDAAPKAKSHVWQNYRGGVLSRISAFEITQKYLNVSPHVLRHSYATALILGGADLRVVQDLLGHASMLTTQIYTHIEKSALRETMLQHHPLNKELL